VSLLQADGSVIIGTELDTQNVETSMNKLGTKIKTWAAGAAAAWAALNVAVIATGDAFDAPMGTIQAQTGMADEAIAQLGYRFRDLSQLGTHSATEIATAFTKVATQGRTVEESYKLMSYAQTLANATSFELKQSTEFLGLALMKTGADVSKSQSYIDTFSQVVASSGMSLGNLQKAVITLAPTMNASGKSIEYMGGTLATLYRGGLYGVAAGRGLEQIFNQLTGPSDAAAAAMDRLGISMFDSTGAVRPLNDVLLEAMDALDDVATEQERINLAQDLFSTVYARAVFDELKNNRDAWQENIKLMYEAGDAFDGMGQAWGMAETAGLGFSTSLGSIGHALQDVFISLWHVKEGAKVALLDTIGEGLWVLARMLRSDGELHGAVLAFGAINEVVFNALIVLLRGVIDIVVFLIRAMDFGSAMATLQPLQGAIGNLFDAFSNLITAVGNFITALIGISDSNAPSFLSQLLEVIVTLITAGIEIAINKLNLLRETLGFMTQAVRNTSFDAGLLGDLFKALSNVIGTLVSAFGNLLSIIGGAIINAIWDFSKGLDSGVTLGGILNTVIGALITILDIFSNAIEAINRILSGALPQAFDAIIQLVKSLASGFLGLGEHLPTFLNVITQVASVVGGAVLLAFEALVNIAVFLLDTLNLLYPVVAILAAKFIKVKVVSKIVTMFNALNIGMMANKVSMVALSSKLALFKKGVIASFVPLTTFTGKLTTASKTTGIFSMALGKAKAALTATTALFVKIAGPIAIAVTAIVFFTDAFSNLHPMVGAVTVALAAFIASFQLLNASTTTVTAVKTAFTTLYATIKAFKLAPLIGYFTALFATMKTSVATVGLLNTVLHGLSVAYMAVKKAAIKFKAVLLANPFVLAAAAVTALVVAIGYLIKRNMTATEGYEDLAAISREAAQAQQEFERNVEQASHAVNDNIRAIDEQAARNQYLTDTIVSLANEQNRTVGETVRMNRYIDELNQAIPGLNLAFDETENSLNRSTQAMQLFIDSSRAIEYLNTLVEESNRLSAERTEISGRVAETEQRLIQLNEQQDQGIRNRNANQIALSQAIVEAEATLARYNDMLGNNTRSQDGLTQRIDEQMGVVGRLRQEQNELIQTLANQQAAIQALEGVLNQYAKVVSDTFKQASQDSEASATSLLNDLRKVNAGLENSRQEWDLFGMYMQRIEKLAAELDVSDEVVNELRGMGLQGLPIIQDFVNDGGGMLEEMDQIFKDISANTVQAVASEFSALGDTMDDAMELAAQAIQQNAAMENSMVEAVVQAFDAAKDAVKTNDPASIGMAFGDGAVEGLESTYGDLRQSGEGAVDEIAEGMESAGLIRSPSKRTKTIGEFLAEGLVQGLEPGKTKSRTVAKEIIESITTTLEGLSLEATGRQIMQGLINGMNAKMADVRRIAAEISATVENTVRTSMQIHSPSRIMERIGNNIVDGVVVGIDALRGAAVGAAQRMSDGIKDAASEWVDDYANATEILIKDEIDKWGNFLNAYDDQAQRQKEIDRQNSLFRMEIRQNDFSNNKEYLEKMLESTKLSKSEEIFLLENLARHYLKNSDERIKIETRLRDRQAALLDEIHKKQRDVMAQMRQAENEYTQAVENRTQALSRTFNMQRELSLQETGVDRNRQEVERLTEVYDRNRAALSDVVAEMIAAQVAGEDYTEINERLQAAHRDVANSHTELTTAMERSTQSQATIWANNLQDQIDNMNDWANEIDRLAQKGLYEGLVEHMRQMGPESVNYLRELNNSSREELERLSHLYQEQHATARRVAGEELVGLRQDTNERLRELAGDLDRLGQQEFQAGGRNLSRGIQEGIRSEQTNVQAAGRETVNTYANAVGQSGSQQMPQQGQQLVSNVAQGVNQGSPQMRNAADSVTRQFKDSMRNAQFQAQDTGSQLARGVADGVDRGAWGIRSAMEAAANSAALAAMRALKIRSPSRVGIYIGDMFSKGIAGGIDKGAKAVEYAVEQITDYMTALEYPNMENMYKNLVDSKKALQDLDKFYLKIPEPFVAAQKITQEQQQKPSGTTFDKLVLHIHYEGNPENYDIEYIGRQIAQDTIRDLRSKGVVVHAY